jgi:hypothetical protein
LEEEVPLLLAFYKSFEETMRAQTEFSDKIRGPDAGDFYGLAAIWRMIRKRTYGPPRASRGIS